MEFSDEFEKDSEVQRPVAPQDSSEGDYLDFVSPDYRSYECIHGSNVVSCLPILSKECGSRFTVTNSEQKFLVRREVCPAYSVRSESSDEFFTPITGMIEDEDSPKEALFKELREEAGIYDVEGEILWQEANVPLWKPTTERLYVCALRITDCKFEDPEGDGTELEEDSETLPFGLSDIEEMRGHFMTDLLLKYLLARTNLVLS